MTPRDAEVARMFHEGRTDVEIAEAMGLSRSGAGYVRRTLGLRRPPRIDHKLVVEMYTARATALSRTEVCAWIARTVGCDIETVRRILHSEGALAKLDRSIDPEKVRRADAMLDGTITFAEVAETVGLKYDWVRTRFAGRGLARENQGAQNSARRMEKELGLRS